MHTKNPWSICTEVGREQNETKTKERMESKQNEVDKNRRRKTEGLTKVNEKNSEYYFEKAGHLPSFPSLKYNKEYLE